jgi:dolichyl-phosphate beta-glucosyltransferase
MYLSFYPFVSLVIPCYNEATRLPQMWDGIKHFIAEWKGNFEIIIIDDGSKDDTAQLINENPMFKTLVADHKAQLIQNINTGKGHALQLGVQAALGDFILTLDADMATSPLEIIFWQLKNPKTFDGTTITIANRTDADSKLVLISSRRRHGNLFNKIVKKFTTLNYNDTQCGFKLYPSLIGKQLFAALLTPGWAHDVELLLRAQQLNYTVQQMPITWNERGASKVNVVLDGLKMIWDVVKISRMV